MAARSGAFIHRVLDVRLDRSDPSVYAYLLDVKARRGAGFVVLVDPDKLSLPEAAEFAETCAAADVDALFLGGSLMHATDVDDYVAALKEASALPVVGFPGSLHQITRSLDAVLFLSVISGRNAEYLFGQHVYAAPVIRRLGIEPISTGYMLVESGRTTTAQYMSHSMPLPRRKPDVAAATALAAEMMGMRMLFADGGSGADDPVPEDMIRAISETCTVPLIVGGGLYAPRQISDRVDAGADFVVVGTAIEQRADAAYVAEMAAAAHVSVTRPL